MPLLKVTSGAAAGFEFDFDQQAVIGRGESADVSLSDPGISRRHARISSSPEGWVLSDLQSANGTFVNGRRVSEPLLLRDGDRFAVASVEIVLMIAGERRPELRYTDDEGPVLESVAAKDATDLLFSQATPDDAGIAELRQRLRLMHEVTEVLASTADETALLRAILQKVFGVFPGVERGSVLVLDDGSEQLLPRVSTTRGGSDVDVAVSRTMVWDAIDNRRAILSVDATSDDRFAGAKTVQNLALHAVACVPMLFRDQVYGVIHLDGPDPEQAIRPPDLPVLMAIGAQAGMGIAMSRAHARHVQRELESQDLALARRIQVRFLPNAVPDVPGWDFWAESRPAFEVGGDYYAYLKLPDGRLGIAVGDVGGRGVSGALYMARLSSEIRCQTAATSDVKEIVGRLNGIVSRDTESDVTVTLLIVALDPDLGEVQIVRAGHNAPLLRSPSGSVAPLNAPRNAALGADRDTRFEDIRYVLLPGEMVILYTDGITHRVNDAGEQLGTARLAAAIAKGGRSAVSVGQAAVAAVEQFGGNAPQNDDFTFVCFGPAGDRRSIDTTDRRRPVAG